MSILLESRIRWRDVGIQRNPRELYTAEWISWLRRRGLLAHRFIGPLEKGDRRMSSVRAHRDGVAEIEQAIVRRAIRWPSRQPSTITVHRVYHPGIERLDPAVVRREEAVRVRGHPVHGRIGGLLAGGPMDRVHQQRRWPDGRLRAVVSGTGREVSSVERRWDPSGMAGRRSGVALSRGRWDDDGGPERAALPPQRDATAVQRHGAAGVESTCCEDLRPASRQRFGIVSLSGRRQKVPLSCLAVPSERQWARPIHLARFHASCIHELGPYVCPRTNSSSHSGSL